jgi:hypothetical protein
VRIVRAPAVDLLHSFSAARIDDVKTAGATVADSRHTT